MRRRLSGLNSEPSIKEEYLDLLVDLFRQDGWGVERGASFADKGADLAISRGGLRYIVAFKVSSEGRRDRLVPLLSQAILQAGAAARASSGQAVPLAVVAARSIPRSAADGLASFLSEVAPDAAVGIVDREGFRRFVGSGLETLTAAPTRSKRRQKLRVPDSANLYSDLNQWLMKVLLAPLVPEDLLQAPRGEYRNASELAAAANVSVMSAFRLLRQLRQEGFLDDESEPLRLIRRQELMLRWQAAYLRPMPELSLRWIDPVISGRQLPAALRAYHDNSSSRSAPRACLGLFAAAECLGYGSVQGIPPVFYLENLDRDILGMMGFSPDGAEYSPDLFVRVPLLQKSIFDAAVPRDGVPTADIIQVWLDVSSHPARDDGQVNEIRRHALAQIFKE
jgi:hypothetical protein